MQATEAVVIAMTTTLVGFLLILGLPDCHPRGTDTNENQIQVEERRFNN